jgi:hypothetical protein
MPRRSIRASSRVSGSSSSVSTSDSPRLGEFPGQDRAQVEDRAGLGHQVLGLLGAVGLLGQRLQGELALRLLDLAQVPAQELACQDREVHAAPPRRQPHHVPVRVQRR